MNSVAPGFIRTTAADRLVERISTGMGIDREAALEQADGIPLGRPAEPEQVAALVPTG